MKNIACSFSGHRTFYEDKKIISENLEKEIVKLIEEHNVKFFLVGGAIGFDMLCEEIIIKLKKTYDIKLILILPCKNQEKYWKAKDKIKFALIKKKADKIIYLQKNYDNFCMKKRNQYLIDNSTYFIYYLRKNNSGTSSTFNYALLNKRKIISL